MLVISYLNKRGFFHKRRNGIIYPVPDKSLQRASQRVNNSIESCTECGAPIKTKGALFCSNCGKNL